MNESIEFFRQMLPVRKEVIWGACSGMVGTIETYLFGEWNAVLEALVAAMVVDYVSGVLAAYINPGDDVGQQDGVSGNLQEDHDSLARVHRAFY